MLDEQAFIAIFKKHYISDYYIGTSLSNTQLNQIITKFLIPSDEKIIIFVDISYKKSNEAGLVFGLSGVYFKNSRIYGSQQLTRFVSYESFQDLKITWINKWTDKCIYLSRVFKFSLDDSRLKPVVFVELLEDVQKYLRTVLSSTKQSANPKQYWITKNEEQLGPYDLEKIKEMVQNGQLNHRMDCIWTEGMSKWEPISYFQYFTSEQLISPSPLPLVEKEEGEKRLTFLEVPFDINQAEEHDLLTLPSIDVTRAQRLLEYRRNKGQIKSYDTLYELWHLQPHEYEEIKSLIKITAHKVSNFRGRMIDF